MTFTARGPLARFWLSDRFGGWSLAEIVGTAAVGGMAVGAVLTLVAWAVSP